MRSNHGFEMNRSRIGFTLDTSVVINILKNPNIGALVSNRLNFVNANIHLCAQVIFEAKIKGYAINFKQIQSITKAANIIYGKITNNMQNNAKILKIHKGDSRILAYAKATRTILVTCDNEFAKVAAESDVVVINPDHVVKRHN